MCVRKVEKPGKCHSDRQIDDERREHNDPDIAPSTSANSATKTAIATQSMDVPLLASAFTMVVPDGERLESPLEINKRRHDRANDDPRKLVPKEG